MSDPKKNFICRDCGTVINDIDRLWGKETPCPQCEMEKMERELVAKDYKHKWDLSIYTSPSGKVLMYCPVCKLYDPAPVKDEYETRECKPDKYKDSWEERDGKIYVKQAIKQPL